MAQANTVDQSSAEIPIAVDMDGTLILTDMSWVSIKRVILRRPWSIVGMLAKEFTGKRAQSVSYTHLTLPTICSV